MCAKERNKCSPMLSLIDFMHFVVNSRILLNLLLYLHDVYAPNVKSFFNISIALPSIGKHLLQMKCTWKLLHKVFRNYSCIHYYFLALKLYQIVKTLTKSIKKGVCLIYYRRCWDKMCTCKMLRCKWLRTRTALHNDMDKIFAYL